MKGVLRVGSRWRVCARHCSSTAAAADITDKYAETLVAFAAKLGRPPVRLNGIRYDGTVKRFYQKVDVEETIDGFAPTIGGRFLQTNGGFLLEVPSRLLATSIALEWDCQKNVIKPHLMPLNHLATQAIDQVATRRHEMHKTVLTFVNFDSACVRDYDFPKLSRVQDKYLDPIVAWVGERFGVKVNITGADNLQVDPVKQSQETINAIENRLKELTDWEYAAFDASCGVSKSIMISLAILEGQLDLPKAFECARLEENYAMRKNGKIGGCFGHDIDIDFTKARISAARTFINMINYDTAPAQKAFSQRNSFVNPSPKAPGKTLTKLKESGDEEPFAFV
jgi:ATP synthase F1 complex assembly factor 2